MSNKQNTHFGYQRVAVAEKAKKVARVFDSVATRYDLMNDLMSMGIHRLWKRLAVELSGARRGQRILDLAGGTGDFSKQFSRIVGAEGEVWLADINAAMLCVGRDKLIDIGTLPNIHYVQANAESLPFPSNSIDTVVISFGLRNVTDKDAAIASMYDVLKPGGRLIILEFSKPVNKNLSKVYDAYSFSVLPMLGKIMVNDADSYRYLAESIRMHPDQVTLKGMMQQAGFEQCEYFNLTGGIVALHRGFKY